MKAILRLAVLAFAFFATSTFAQVKIAYIDPLSGLMAATGEHGLHELEFAAEQINAKGGVLGQKIEIVPLDNKLNTQESLVVLKGAIDQGIHYVVQGNGSSVAGALIDAINKNNERDPSKAVVFLNYAAVDPDFTNDKCSFWHFRFDANSDMKMEALTSYMKGDKNLHKVYILNQDYQFGHQVARAAREMITAKRPDVQIVGEELHPLAKVKDFSPYVSKIQASGADSIVTGNWGSDLQLLVKAAKDANLKADFFTYYAGVVGTPPALGDSGVDRVKVVTYWNSNAVSPAYQSVIDAYKKKYGATSDPYTGAMRMALTYLTDAMKKANSTEPAKVAKAMEGMTEEGPFGPTEMRASDHQLIQPLFVLTFAKAGGALKNTADGTTDYSFKQDIKLDGPATARPTTCKMQRPS
ncbi:MAG TPA: branched-chain amino acid ABC transporter substrate-binding protein [Usitatibacter sp.]|nr:branched-chain amino acid ABC transporter substrate-binding protein [Usitatibacter sp.]